MAGIERGRCGYGGQRGAQHRSMFEQLLNSQCSQLGRILVIPAEANRKPQDEDDYENEPLLLLALNAPSNVSWNLLEAKVCYPSVASTLG